jgi:hypothetical protein
MSSKRVRDSNDSNDGARPPNAKRKTSHDAVDLTRTSDDDEVDALAKPISSSAKSSSLAPHPLEPAIDMSLINYVLACGSRLYEDRDMIRRWLAPIHEYGRDKSRRVHLVHGDAKGADKIARKVALVDFQWNENRIHAVAANW